jgi:uncharacterized GH25 family protein
MRSERHHGWSKNERRNDETDYICKAFIMFITAKNILKTKLKNFKDNGKYQKIF